MKTASERHARIHFYNKLARCRFILLPARFYHDPVSHLSRLEVLLPFVQPLTVITGIIVHDLKLCSLRRVRQRPEDRLCSCPLRPAILIICKINGDLRPSLKIFHKGIIQIVIPVYIRIGKNIPDVIRIIYHHSREPVIDQFRLDHRQIFFIDFDYHFYIFHALIIAHSAMQRPMLFGLLFDNSLTAC